MKALIYTVVGSIVLFPATASAGAPVYKTPEDVFAAAKKAAEKEDMKAFMSCLTEDSREVLAGGVALMGVIVKGFMEGFVDLFAKNLDKLDDKTKADIEKQKAQVRAKLKPLNEALSKHGLTEEVLKKMGAGGPVDSKDPKAMQEAIRKLVAPIKDRPAFVLDMMTALKKMDEKKKADGSPLQGGGVMAKDAMLKDVMIENGTAKGIVISKSGDQERREPIHFRRVGASWLIEMPVDQLKFGPGPKEKQ